LIVICYWLIVRKVCIVFTFKKRKRWFYEIISWERLSSRDYSLPAKSRLESRSHNIEFRILTRSKFTDGRPY